MTRILLLFAVGALAALQLAACGGGGGGGGPITTAVTKVYLFGNVTTTVTPHIFSNTSSNVRVSYISTSLNVPAGVLVNYSAAVGASTGDCILRKGVFVPSGAITPGLTESNFSASRYNIDPNSKKLTIKVANSGMVKLRASTTKNSGKGEEIGSIVFRLAAPGVKPDQTFDAFYDPLPTVSVSDNNLGGSSDDMSSPRINFVTTYQ